MNTKPILIFICLKLAALYSVSQDMKYIPKHAATVDTITSPKELKQCSRSIPKGISGFWKLDSSSIQSLENNFLKLYGMKEAEKGKAKYKVDTLNTFAFQYVGLVIHGKKFIYINAYRVCNIFDECENTKENLLADHFVNVCDGGSDFWGVLFAIKTQTFRSLTFNDGG